MKVKKTFHSLTGKFILSIGALMIVGSAVFWYFLIYYEERGFIRNAEKYGYSFADVIRKSIRYGMLTFQPHLVQQTVEAIGSAEDVMRVRVFDCNSRVAYSSKKDEKGIVLEIEIVERPYPTIKHLAYMQNVFFLNNAKRQGAQEVLFISEKKEICECANSNFFFVKNGALYTAPPDRVYPGVTRELVLKIAKQNHIPVYEKPISLKDLKETREELEIISLSDFIKQK